VVNISRVVRYKKLIKRQKVGESKLVEVDKVKEWKVENKKKSIRNDEVFSIIKGIYNRK